MDWKKIWEGSKIQIALLFLILIIQHSLGLIYFSSQYLYFKPPYLALLLQFLGFGLIFWIGFVLARSFKYKAMETLTVGAIIGGFFSFINSIIGMFQLNRDEFVVSTASWDPSVAQLVIVVWVIGGLFGGIALSALSALLGTYLVYHSPKNWMDVLRRRK